MVLIISPNSPLRKCLKKLYFLEACGQNKLIPINHKLFGSRSSRNLKFGGLVLIKTTCARQSSDKFTSKRTSNNLSHHKIYNFNMSSVSSLKLRHSLLSKLITLFIERRELGLVLHPHPGANPTPFIFSVSLLKPL